MLACLQSIYQDAKYLLESAVPNESFQEAALLHVHFMKRLGGGSFGNVYACTLIDSRSRAVDPQVRRKLKPYFARRRNACVKLLHALMDPDWREQCLRDYRRELLAHSSFEHPRIVQFIGEVPRQTHPFLGETCGIVMEHVDCTLKRYMDEVREKLEPGGEALWQQMVQLGQDIAEGLQALHEHPLKIVHRDIHEENVLILQGRAMIGDLGRGKALAKYAADTIHTREPGMLLIVPPEASGSNETYECSYDIYGMAFILAKLVLCVGLSHDEWRSRLTEITKGPLAHESFWKQSRTKQDELVQEWKAWIMQQAHDSCCSRPAGGERYWDLIVACCSAEPSFRPQAGSIYEELGAIMAMTSSSEKMSVYVR